MAEALLQTVFWLPYISIMQLSACPSSRGRVVKEPVACLVNRVLGSGFGSAKIPSTWLFQRLSFGCISTDFGDRGTIFMLSPSSTRHVMRFFRFSNHFQESSTSRQISSACCRLAYNDHAKFEFANFQRTLDGNLPESRKIRENPG